ncbi:MAG: permease [Caldisericia bacterium]|nr:permease [Caldisericia bacterium]
MRKWIEDNKRDLILGLTILAVFLIVYFVNLGTQSVLDATKNGLDMLNEYARLHVLTCLIPAFFIAGGIAALVSSGSVIKILSGKVGKVWAYVVGSVSGSILAVCSCTVLPLFMGIYRMGAGIGPAISFLYAGPAINVLAIFLTGRVLGAHMGIARAVLSIIIALITGITMGIIFGKEDKKRLEGLAPVEGTSLPAVKSSLILGSLVLLLIFATWQKDAWELIYQYKWWLAGAMLVLAIILTIVWLKKADFSNWMKETWDLSKKVVPYLFFGVFIAAFVIRLIPQQWVQALVGGNSLSANFFSAVFSAVMYEATLTEVPIVQGLMNSGMGQGPALTYLLAGPALSLPSMIVIWKLIGAKKSMVYFSLVVVLSTVFGWLYGIIF